MDAYKSMTVWELLSFLKETVKKNVDTINKYIAEIREYRKNPPESFDFNTKINQINGDISSLTAENNKFLGLFNDLLRLHNDFLIKSNIPKNNPDGIKKVEISEEFISTCIEETINGSFPLDKYHPFLEDEKAFEALLHELEKREMYEKCNLLIKLKNSYLNL